MSLQKNCILGQVISTKNGIIVPCTSAGGQSCNQLCIDYNMLHGLSGIGGKIGDSNIPKEYRLITVQNAPVRHEQESIYKVIDKYVESFAKMFNEELPKEERIRSLYLYSKNPGTGKSTTAAALLNEFILRHYIGSLKLGIAPKQNIGYYLDVNEWQNLFVGFTRSGIPSEIANEKSKLFYHQMELAKHTQFLVLDDIAVRTTVSDAFRGELHSIVNHRINNALPTVYTSNVALSELPSLFGEERLYDRVRHYCIQLDFEGDSHRGMGKK